MQFDKFTMKSQEAIQTAQRLAQDLGHQEIQVAHLAKTIITQPEGIVVPVLKKMGIDPSLVLMDLNHLLEKIPKVSGQGAGQSYASRDLKKILDDSFAAAQQMQDEYVSQEHLFLAILKNPAVDVCRPSTAGASRRRNFSSPSRPCAGATG